MLVGEEEDPGLQDKLQSEGEDGEVCWQQ